LAVSIVEFGTFFTAKIKVVSVVFAGVFEKPECQTWCFCGQVVVECVVNEVIFRGRKMRQVFQLFFAGYRSVTGEGKKLTTVDFPHHTVSGIDELSR